MKIIITDRQMGKTTAVLDWLLLGKHIDTPPYWSRVVVCVHQAQVSYLVTEIMRRASFTPDLADSYEPIRRSVWTLRSLTHGPLRGYDMSEIEVAFDDVDLALSVIAGKTPSLVTMTGELVAVS